MADWWWSPIISAAAGLGGVWIGSWLGARREREQRRFDFIKQQLEEFYAPLFGLRQEIRAKGELRVRISTAANAAWHELLRDVEDPEQKRELVDRELPTYQRIIDYDNEQFAKETLPTYQAMLDVFRSKIWLAEEPTRQYLRSLVEFIDVWNRWVTLSIPYRVVERLGHEESVLYPFYDDVEKQLISLRAQLQTGGQ